MLGKDLPPVEHQSVEQALWSHKDWNRSKNLKKALRGLTSLCGSLVQNTPSHSLLPLWTISPSSYSDPVTFDHAQLTVTNQKGATS